MAIYAVGPSTYDLLSDLLKTLWRNDDILFEEDCAEAKQKADVIASILTAGSEIQDILEKADGNYLEQDDLFELQDLVGELAEEYARIEHRTKEFRSDFPWLRGDD